MLQSKALAQKRIEQDKGNFFQQIFDMLDKNLDQIMIIIANFIIF